MTVLTLQLILALVPGAIGNIIFGQLIVHKKWTQFQFVTNSILFGIISYMFLALIKGIIYYPDINENKRLKIFSILSESKIVHWSEIGAACFVAIILAFCLAYLVNEKVLNRIAEKLSISRKYGEENLYTQYCNRPDIEVVYVRDMQNEIIYHGQIYNFSEDEKIVELVLQNVKVYDIEATFLYNINHVYLSFNRNNLIIEQANE